QGGMVTRSSFHGMDDVAVLTLDNPEKKNALTGKMMYELHESIKEIAESPAQLRALVIRGAGGNFCPGADLDFVRKAANPQGGFILSNYMSETLWDMASLPMPVIAVLERNCLGGAAELAIAADVRVACTNARMSFVHSRMGITPGFGSVRFLRDVVGRSTAIELLASGELMDVERLKDLRLVNTVYKTEEELAEYLQKFTRNSAHVVRASKMAVRDAMDRKGWQDRRKGEQRLFHQLWGSK
ncbi:hypothetical protein PMAYCL1PPCAC_11127, partial [Pristionchus mayeri]